MIAFIKSAAASHTDPCKSVAKSRCIFIETRNVPDEERALSDT
jgi:hypothetical protein